MELLETAINPAHFMRRRTVNDDRLLKILGQNNATDEDAIGMIFSNYIDIGGTLIGLTVENAILAGKLLRKYDSMVMGKSTTKAQEAGCE